MTKFFRRLQTSESRQAPIQLCVFGEYSSRSILKLIARASEPLFQTDLGKLLWSDCGALSDFRQPPRKLIGQFNGELSHLVSHACRLLTFYSWDRKARKPIQSLL